MNFSQLFEEAQQQFPISAAKLPQGVYFLMQRMDIGTSGWGECVIVTLDDGRRIYLPKNMTAKLAPHVQELRREQGWGLAYIGSRQESILKQGSTTERHLINIPRVSIQKMPDYPTSDPAETLAVTPEENRPDHLMIENVDMKGEVSGSDAIESALVMSGNGGLSTEVNTGGTEGIKSKGKGGKGGRSSGRVAGKKRNLEKVLDQAIQEDKRAKIQHLYQKTLNRGDLELQYESQLPNLLYVSDSEPDETYQAQLVKDLPR